MYLIKGVIDESFSLFCFVPQSVVINNNVQQFASEPRDSTKFASCTVREKTIISSEFSQFSLTGTFLVLGVGGWGDKLCQGKILLVTN